MSLLTVDSAPGVYIEEKFSLSFSVNPGATAVPVFAGKFLDKSGNGISATSGCFRIQDWMDFESRFHSASMKVTVDFGATATKPEPLLPRPIPSLESDKKDAKSLDLQGNKEIEYSVAFGDGDHRYAALMLRHYFDNGGGPCYIIPYAGSSDFPGLSSEIRKFPDINLLVIAIAGNFSRDIAGALNNLLQEDKGYFLIAHSTTATTEVKPATEPKQTGFYVPYLEVPYKDLRVDDLVKVTGYAGKRGAQKGPVSNLAQLESEDPDLYADICADIDEQLAALVVPPLPPSGAVAAAYCRTDRERGVWKAPANVELRGVTGVSKFITEEAHGGLNSDGVNVIRWFGNRGAVIYGARTMVPATETAWRYIPVRRLFNTAERDIKQAMHVVVFEPNAPPTWEKARTAIDSYLHSLWRQGALKGNTPQEAYYIHVGKDITMTDVDIKQGKMIVKIGMAAVRPAEFIVLEFTQEVGRG